MLWVSQDSRLLFPPPVSPLSSSSPLAMGHSDPTLVPACLILAGSLLSHSFAYSFTSRGLSSVFVYPSSKSLLVKTNSLCKPLIFRDQFYSSNLLQTSVSLVMASLSLPSVQIDPTPKPLSYKPPAPNGHHWTSQRLDVSMFLRAPSARVQRGNLPFSFLHSTSTLVCLLETLQASDALWKAAKL